MLSYDPLLFSHFPNESNEKVGARFFYFVHRKFVLFLFGDATECEPRAFSTAAIRLLRCVACI